jgi:hypothetical protein
MYIISNSKNIVFRDISFCKEKLLLYSKNVASAGKWWQLFFLHAAQKKDIITQGLHLNTITMFFFP